MCSYLHRAPHGVYYFRMSIPAELRPAMGGKREIKISLGLKDRDAAKAVIPDHTKAALSLLEQVRRDMAHAQPKDPAQIATERREQEQARQQAAWDAENADFANRQVAEWDDNAEAQDEADQKVFAQSPEIAAIVERMSRHQRERAEIYKERWLISQAAERAVRRPGDSLAATRQPALTSLPKPPAPSERRSPGNPAAVTVTGLFDAYTKDRKITPAIVSEWRSGIDKFVKFIGHDDAFRVTEDNVQDWRDHEAKQPKPNGEPRSPQRINAGFLAPLRGAFKYGRAQRLIPHNPAEGVAKLHVPSKVETRERMFTKDEARTILAAALKADDNPAKRLQGLARRWIPWLCAYSGARVNEITQMRAEDVWQEDGHWFMRITPDAGTTKTKKFRNVPVHEHLVEQGFLEVVKAQGTGPLFYDPARGNEDGERERGQNKKVGERLATWVRSLGISDPAIMPNHAWRHTFVSKAMDADIDERASNYITGHASVGVSRTRYTHHSFGPLAKQMAKFPRYHLE